MLSRQASPPYRSNGQVGPPYRPHEQVGPPLCQPMTLFTSFFAMCWDMWGAPEPPALTTVHMFQIYYILVGRIVIHGQADLSNTWWADFVVGRLVLLPKERQSRFVDS